MASIRFTGANISQRLFFLLVWFDVQLIGLKPMKISIDSFLRAYQEDVIKLYQEFPKDDLQHAIEVLWETYEHDRQIFFCGNGGSAASSSHIAQDLAKGSMGRKGELPIRAVRAIALTNDMSQITAWANDTGFNNIFVGQLKVLMNPGDVVVGISGSGNSENVVHALRYAKDKGNKTIAFVAFDGGIMKDLAGVVIHVQSTHYGQLEDLHMSMGHMIAYWFQNELAARHES